MRTIRKQTLLRAGAALVPAILALTLLAACLPVRTEITQLTAEDLDSTDPKEALVLAEMEDEESTWGTVSRVCRTGLLGAEETYYLVPYLRTQVRVWAPPGSSDWFLEPGCWSWPGRRAACGAGQGPRWRPLSCGRRRMRTPSFLRSSPIFWNRSCRP